MRAPFVLALLAVGALVATGCGGDNGRERPTPEPASSGYESSVRSIHADMNDAMAAAFGSETLDEALIRNARTTAVSATGKMAEADPPARFAEAHSEYVRGLETFVDILTDVETQVDDPNVARRHLGDKRFTTGVAHLERASELYEEAGLELDESAGP